MAAPLQTASAIFLLAAKVMRAPGAIKAEQKHLFDQTQYSRIGIRKYP